MPAEDLGLAVLRSIGKRLLASGSASNPIEAFASHDREPLGRHRPLLRTRESGFALGFVEGLNKYSLRIGKINPSDWHESSIAFPHTKLPLRSWQSLRTVDDTMPREQRPYAGPNARSDHTASKFAVVAARI